MDCTGSRKGCIEEFIRYLLRQTQTSQYWIENVMIKMYVWQVVDSDIFSKLFLYKQVHKV